MKGLKKTRRIQIIALAFVALAGSTALIGYAMRDGINFFRAPAQVIAEQSKGARLVVLGRHHHGRIAKILVGSTSESALHQVTSPIVIVPSVRFTQVSTLLPLPRSLNIPARMARCRAE